MKINNISIVIPVLNEEKNLNNLVNQIKRVKDEMKIDKFELIFVDDNSNDNTQQILINLKKKYKFLKYFFRNNKKKDLSRSCILGFEKSIYKNILVMDGDLQHDPRYIPKLIKKYETASSDLVVGCRDFFNEKNKGLNFIRTLASLILIFAINIMLGKQTSDPMSGFFLFKKKIYTQSKKKFYKKGYKILADIIYNNKNNIQISEIKINFKKRIHGKSKLNIKVLFYLIIFIFNKFNV